MIIPKPILIAILGLLLSYCLHPQVNRHVPCSYCDANPHPEGKIYIPNDLHAHDCIYTNVVNFKKELEVSNE